ncbi:MAG: hypothetical protein EOP83_08120 [Verrucomicrobiaceae bacterium]|nr:MAG: hypothetical protein EOP83_08120 [Verrucomicrobiaceae bacterium]
MDNWFFLSYGAMVFGLVNVALICENMRGRCLNHHADLDAAMLYTRIGSRLAELIVVTGLLFPVLIAGQVLFEFISLMLSFNG